MNLTVFLLPFAGCPLLCAIFFEKPDRLSVKKIIGNNRKDADSNNGDKRGKGKEKTLIIQIVQIMKVCRDKQCIINNAEYPSPVSNRINDDATENTERRLHEGDLPIENSTCNDKKCPATEQADNGNFYITGEKIKGTLFHLYPLPGNRSQSR